MSGFHRRRLDHRADVATELHPSPERQSAGRHQRKHSSDLDLFASPFANEGQFGVILR